MIHIAKYLLPFAAILFFIGIKVEHYNSFFIITAIIIGGISIFILVSAEDKETKQANKRFDTWKNDLIKNGLKFTVNLNECTVISNSYKQEIIDEHNSEMDKYKALDALSGRDTRTFENIQQSVILYEQEINGKRIKFYSDTIDKDAVTLQFYLSSKKNTWLYVNPLNTEDYYFDLSFLD